MKAARKAIRIQSLRRSPVLPKRLGAALCALVAVAALVLPTAASAHSDSRRPAASTSARRAPRSSARPRWSRSSASASRARPAAATSRSARLLADRSALLGHQRWQPHRRHPGLRRRRRTRSSPPPTPSSPTAATRPAPKSFASTKPADVMPPAPDRRLGGRGAAGLGSAARPPRTPGTYPYGHADSRRSAP